MYKNEQEVLRFSNIEIEKNKFYCHKSPVFKKDVDIEKVLVSNKISSAEKSYKYFVGQLYYDCKFKPLHIMLPKTSPCVKSYDGQIKQTYFLIEEDDLLEKYNTILCKVQADVKKEFDSKPV